jgi:predicted enzyme related to lactoylglutathione lyase
VASRRVTSDSAARKATVAQPVVHFEIIGQDAGLLRSYYGELFGWEFQVGDATTESGRTRATTGSWTGAGPARGSTVASAEASAMSVESSSL